MFAAETKDIVKKYGEKTAVYGVSIRAEEGELFALLGVNGAGKIIACGTLPELEEKSGENGLENAFVKLVGGENV